LPRTGSEHFRLCAEPGHRLRPGWAPLGYVNELADVVAAYDEPILHSQYDDGFDWSATDPTRHGLKEGVSWGRFGSRGEIP
jgi:hypothetical protein